MTMLKTMMAGSLVLLALAAPAQPAMAPIGAAASPQAGAKPAKPSPAPAAPKAATQKPVVPQTAAAPQVVPPADYMIGADDVLIVAFRREKDMSAEVAVRPDGKITLPLLNDIQAAGLTTDQLRARVTDEAKRFVEEPSVTVIVKQINSRKVFVTGEVGKPGAYPIGDRMTVMQLISMAGGLTEFAKKKNIAIIREAGVRPGARPVTFRFNYDDVQKLKNLASNIELRPGDTVIVP
jgi:polysaccharide biosynthesis/export protein